MFCGGRSVRMFRRHTAVGASMREQIAATEPFLSFDATSTPWKRVSKAEPIPFINCEPCFAARRSSAVVFGFDQIFTPWWYRSHRRAGTPQCFRQNLATGGAHRAIANSGPVCGNEDGRRDPSLWFVEATTFCALSITSAVTMPPPS